MPLERVFFTGKRGLTAKILRVFLIFGRLDAAGRLLRPIFAENGAERRPSMMWNVASSGFLRPFFTGFWLPTAKNLRVFCRIAVIFYG